MEMETTTRAFMEKFAVKNGEPYTHGSIVPPRIYYIDEQYTSDFFTWYCKAVKNKQELSITEKPGAYFPLRVDFDFDSPLDVTERQYTGKILRKIVHFYQEEIRKCIDDDEFEDKMLWCVVLEKDAPRKMTGRMHDGFHLHFPYFVCEEWMQDGYLRRKVTQRMIDEQIWKGKQFTKDISEFIDERIAKKMWMMYGSSKGVGEAPYLMTKIYDHDLKKVTIAETFEGDFSKNPKFYLPLLLSIRGFKKTTTLKDTLVQQKEKFAPGKKKRSVIIKQSRPTEEILKDYKTIKDGELIDMLSDERADNYSTWMEVGWCLYNIGQGTDEFLELWIEFSQRSPKFVDGDCEEQWSRMVVKDMTMGSLRMWAKQDSPERYAAWAKTQTNTLLALAIAPRKPNEWAVSGLIHHLYKDRFCCADPEKNLWYEFYNHRWHKMNDAVTLRKIFAMDVAKEFRIYEGVLNNILIEDSTRAAEIDPKKKKCSEMAEALGTDPFHTKLLKMCKLQFHDPFFLEKMNENRHLFGCENGVLDLKLGIFRPGRPDDYITFSCGHEFHEYADDSEELQSVKDFFKKVFPNVNIYNYFLDYCCATLEGGNINKRIIIGTGVGDNGKTVVFTFIEITFGDYCIQLPRELFIVGKGNTSGSARPELARLPGRRLALSQEIAKNETLDIAELKLLSGNDRRYIRGLYEGGKDARPMCNIALQLNELPKIPGHDEATWNRIRIVDFESKFVKPGDEKKYPIPKSKEKQFEMKRFRADLSLSEKMREWAPAFLYMLFQRYKEYKERGMREPLEVQVSTTTYRALNDIYLQYYQDRIEKVAVADGAEEVFLSAKDLYTDFISWHHENYASYREKFSIPSTIHEFSKKLGQAVKKGKVVGWNGYCICEDDDEDDNVNTLRDALKKVKNTSANGDDTKTKK